MTTAWGPVGGAPRKFAVTGRMRAGGAAEGAAFCAATGLKTRPAPRIRAVVRPSPIVCLTAMFLSPRCIVGCFRGRIRAAKAGRSVDKHDLAEPRRYVRPRIGVLRVGPDAHAPVRLDAVPAVEIDLPHGSGDRRSTRQLLEIGPWNHRLEAPAIVSVGAHVQRAPQGGRDLDAGGVE